MVKCEMWTLMLYVWREVLRFSHIHLDSIAGSALDMGVHALEHP